MLLLTPRQREIALLREQGVSQREICARLGITLRCYWQHREDTLRRLSLVTLFIDDDGEDEKQGVTV